MDIESLLEQGHTIEISPRGYSMSPFIRPGDKVVLEKADIDTLKRGEVVLYRRNDRTLVLHRIWKKQKDGFYMLGDGQVTVEGLILGEQIKGKLIAIMRKNREIRIGNPIYFLLSRVWLWIRPLRPMVLVSVGKFYKWRRNQY